MARIRSFSTEQASREELSLIRDLLSDAFEGDFSAEDWAHTMGGHHIIAADEGVLLAHAAVVPRTLEVGGTPMATGYVEGVATRRSTQRRGYASRVMAESATLIRSHYEMGALSTGRHYFYQRLGWERWRGPTFVRTQDGLLRSEEDDDGLMVLRFGPSAEVDVRAAISCEERPGDDW